MPNVAPTPGRRPRLRLFGIRIQLHPTWFIILALLFFTLGSYFRSAQPGWNEWLVWACGLLTTLLFFASVIAHELSHSLVARWRGLPVKAITLFVFGGVSQITREPEKPGVELMVAAAGPLSSLLIGGVLYGLGRMGNVHNPLFAIMLWLGSMNVLLGVFNLVPGFPLDGGRVLRGLLWLWLGDFLQATRWAVRTGQLVAVGFILWGLYEFFTSPANSLSGLWIGFIGWFLLNAAEQTWKETELTRALHGYRVADLTNPFYSWIPPQASLEEYFSRVSEQHDYRPTLVIDGERLVGEIVPADLRDIPREKWEQTPVAQAMRGRERMVTLPADATLVRAVQVMGQAELNQVAVLQGETLRGVLRQERIMQLLQDELSKH